jgi:hypothetical protein
MESFKFFTIEEQGHFLNTLRRFLSRNIGTFPNGKIDQISRKLGLILNM